MRAAPSTESFRASPVGRYLRGENWVFACPSESLFATFLARRPSETDLAALARAYGVPLAGTRMHAVYFDATRVEKLDGPAADLLLRFFHRRAVSYSRTITRVAVAHGPGAIGAVFAGYPKVLPLQCPSRSFAHPERALEWLGADRATREALEDVAATLSSDDAVVTRLRAVLEERPSLGVADAARAIGTSVRSLQRKLGDVGTQYRAEVDRARMSLATKKLEGGSTTIGDIALDLGFASLQSFSDWFRSLRDESPSGYRSRLASARDAAVTVDATSATRSASGPSPSGRPSRSAGAKRTRARAR
ncbi:MAG: helix-turn-helix domain-containing protein [Polyangiaceae bacterium]